MYRFDMIVLARRWWPSMLTSILWSSLLTYHLSVICATPHQLVFDDIDVLPVLHHHVCRCCH
jgi:hypothetical protein